jgi:hypothetical protein
MSALGLFRSRTTRAIASIPPIASKLAFPRYKAAFADSAAILKHHRGRIQAATSNPALDDSQKHRITMRLLAELDLDIAAHKADELARRISEVVDRAEPSSKGAARSRCHEVVRRMELEEWTLGEKVKDLRWQVCKLYLYAPLGDITFSERRARLANYVRGLMLSSRRRSRWPQVEQSQSVHVVPDPFSLFF